jgi:hypothetical protein
MPISLDGSSISNNKHCVVFGPDFAVSNGGKDILSFSVSLPSRLVYALFSDPPGSPGVGAEEDLLLFFFVRKTSRLVVS